VQCRFGQPRRCEPNTGLGSRFRSYERQSFCRSQIGFGDRRQALSVHLGALHKLTLNSCQMLGKQVEAARQSISDEDIRRLSQAAANGAERRAAELARSANWRTVTIATASVLALMCASAVGGWWWRGALPDLTCRDLPDGSRVCFVFTRPPTQQEAAPSTPAAPVAPTQGPALTKTPARH
jgi:hypothetical protein